MMWREHLEVNLMDGRAYQALRDAWDSDRRLQFWLDEREFRTHQLECLTEDDHRLAKLIGVGETKLRHIREAIDTAEHSIANNALTRAARAHEIKTKPKNPLKQTDGSLTMGPHPTAEMIMGVKYN